LCTTTNRFGLGLEIVAGTMLLKKLSSIVLSRRHPFGYFKFSYSLVFRQHFNIIEALREHGKPEQQDKEL
jgi:hypothetical protein